MNDRVPANGIVRVSNNIERVTTLEDGSVVFKPPPNSFADWDFGRVLNRYVDDSGRQVEIKELSPVERQSLCRMVIGGEIHEVSHANDKVFARRLRGHTIVMPCNVAQVQCVHYISICCAHMGDPFGPTSKHVDTTARSKVARTEFV